MALLYLLLKLPTMLIVLPSLVTKFLIHLLMLFEGHSVRESSGQFAARNNKVSPLALGKSAKCALYWLSSNLTITVHSLPSSSSPCPFPLLHTQLAPHIPHRLGVEIGGVRPQPTGEDPCQLPGIMADKVIPYERETVRNSVKAAVIN